MKIYDYRFAPVRGVSVCVCVGGGGVGGRLASGG